MVYLDESGFDTHTKYSYGWSLVGKKVLDNRFGSKGARVNIIAALNASGNIFAPFTFEGSCDKNVFNIYISKVLIPSLKEGSTVILDNASFHKASDIKKLLQNKKCNVLYLPPYSPDLNPIEKSWFPIKNNLRKKFREAIKDPLGTVTEVVKSVIDISR